jgi:hypothetical protein
MNRTCPACGERGIAVRSMLLTYVGSSVSCRRCGEIVVRSIPSALLEYVLLLALFWVAFVCYFAYETLAWVVPWLGAVVLVLYAACRFARLESRKKPAG